MAIGMGTHKSRFEQRNPLIHQPIFLCSGRHGIQYLFCGPLDKLPKHPKICLISGGGKLSTYIYNASPMTATHSDSQTPLALYVCCCDRCEAVACCVQLPGTIYQRTDGWSGRSPLVVRPQKLLYIANQPSNVSFASTGTCLKLH